MAEFDHGIKMIADTTGRALARIAGVACQRLRPIESTLPRTTELLADRAFRASQGRDRFVLYFEFYTRWQRSAPWDMLAKSGFLSQRERRPTVCLAFVLLPRGYKPQRGTFRLASGGRATQQLWFHEVCLWKLRPEAWWEDVPGLMALYPLCAHGRAPRDAIRHSTEAIAAVVPEPAVQAEKLVLLDIFGGLAYPRLDVADLIGRANMRGSRFLREERLDAQREEQLKQQRTHLLKLVRSRFSELVSSELAAAVEALDDPQLLERLFDELLAGASLDALRAALRTAQTSA